MYLQGALKRDENIVFKVADTGHLYKLEMMTTRSATPDERRRFVGNPANPHVRVRKKISHSGRFIGGYHFPNMWRHQTLAFIR